MRGRQLLAVVRQVTDPPPPPPAAGLMDTGSSNEQQAAVPLNSLPQPLAVLRCRAPDDPLAAETTFYVLGTAHVSAASCADVVSLIRAVRPEVVLVELCVERKALLTMEKVKVGDGGCARGRWLRHCVTGGCGVVGWWVQWWATGRRCSPWRRPRSVVAGAVVPVGGGWGGCAGKWWLVMRRVGAWWEGGWRARGRRWRAGRVWAVGWCWPTGRWVAGRRGGRLQLHRRSQQEQE